MTLTAKAQPFRAVFKGLNVLSGYSGTHELTIKDLPSAIVVMMPNVNLDEHHAKQMLTFGWQKIENGWKWEQDE